MIVSVAQDPFAQVPSIFLAELANGAPDQGLRAVHWIGVVPAIRATAGLVVHAIEAA
ncbi:hypothetical protein BVRB_3g064900 [Beta vulgaris subsp. vulgaris]|nr:hypothetical protein BVRB_3g064900 [Beta vulgaris subsp. vulgaris]